MAHDGSEGLSPDGWLPDRISIGVLTRAFPPELVDEVVGATGTREQRRRLLPARLMVYFVLALWLFRGRNCGYGQVMAKLADGLYHQRRGADLLAGQLDPDGWVGRRAGPAVEAAEHLLPVARAREAGRRPGADAVRAGGGADGRGRRAGRVLLRAAGRLDGRVHSRTCRTARRTARSSAGRRTSPGTARSRRPGGSRRPSPGPAACSGRRMGPYRTAEQPLALDLLHCFGPGMLVLADRKFLSWSLARAFLATGAHILWRASASFALKPVTVLADGTYLAELKPPRKSDGPVITVRVIEYTVHTAAEDGGEETSEVFCLVTDLLDTEEYPALDLACCYPDRWGCETVIGRHKTDMGEGQPVLRSEATPRA